MAAKSIAVKSQGRQGRSTQADTSAGHRGIALAPPAYGIDFVDRALAGGGPLQLAAANDPSPGWAPRTGPPLPASGPPNTTGLPDGLKSGIEALSGLSLDHVKVHFNSSRPARWNAFAFARGREIHVAPGRERHLPHEAWHVVQQAQGRVKPTMRLGAGVPVNDDAALEREADLMGAKALAGGPPRPSSPGTAGAPGRPLRQVGGGEGQPQVIQRAVGFEIETNWRVFKYDPTKNQNGPLTQAQKTTNFNADNTNRPAYLTNDLAKGTPIIAGNHFELQVDELATGGKDLEFVTTLPPFEETPTGRAEVITTLTAIENMAATLVGSPLWAIESGDPGVGVFSTPDAVIKRQSTPGMNGSPQTTGAIRLDQVPELFETIGTRANDADASKDEGRTRLMGVTGRGTKNDIEAAIVGDAPAQARQALNDHIQRFSNKFAFRDATRQANVAEANALNSGDLIGIVSLLVTYLRIGDSGQPDYAKQIAPLLARTDFAQMFQMLPQHERTHFHNHKSSWMKMVLDAAGLPGTDDTPVLAHGIGTNPQQPNHILRRVTRGAWLKGIANGRDLMTTAGFVAKYGINQGGAEFESMGRLGVATEQVGRTNPVNDDSVAAPIFELRRMKGSIPYLQWRPLLLRVFDFLVSLNRRDPNPRL